LKATLNNEWRASSLALIIRSPIFPRAKKRSVYFLEFLGAGSHVSEAMDHPGPSAHSRCALCAEWARNRLLIIVDKRTAAKMSW
jgi:hypothetical protein